MIRRHLHHVLAMTLAACGSTPPTVDEPRPPEPTQRPSFLAVDEMGTSTAPSRTDSQAPREVLFAAPGPIREARLSADGRVVLLDGYLIDVDSGDVRAFRPNVLELDPTGTFARLQAGLIHAIWDLRDGSVTPVPPGIFSVDGRHIGFLREGPVLVRRELSTGREAAVAIDIGAGEIGAGDLLLLTRRTAVFADGSTLVAFDVETGERTGHRELGAIRDYAFHPAGGAIVLSVVEGDLEILHPRTLQTVHRVHIDGGLAGGARWDASGRYLLAFTLRDRGGVLVLDGATGEPRLELSGGGGPALASTLAIDPAGSWLLATDDSVARWVTVDGWVLGDARTLPMAAVTASRSSADGTRVVVMAESETWLLGTPGGEVQRRWPNPTPLRVTFAEFLTNRAGLILTARTPDDGTSRSWGLVWDESGFSEREYPPRARARYLTRSGRFTLSNVERQLMSRDGDTGESIALAPASTTSEGTALGRCDAEYHRCGIVLAPSGRVAAWPRPGGVTLFEAGRDPRVIAIPGGRPPEEIALFGSRGLLVRRDSRWEIRDVRNGRVRLSSDTRELSVFSDHALIRDPTSVVIVDGDDLGQRRVQIEGAATMRAVGGTRVACFLREEDGILERIDLASGRRLPPRTAPPIPVAEIASSISSDGRHAAWCFEGGLFTQPLDMEVPARRVGECPGRHLHVSGDGRFVVPESGEVVVRTRDGALLTLNAAAGDHGLVPFAVTTDARFWAPDEHLEALRVREPGPLRTAPLVAARGHASFDAQLLRTFFAGSSD